MRVTNSVTALMLGTGLVALLSACGGGSSAATSALSAATAATSTSVVTFAGSVTNLASGGSLTLEVNGANPQVVSSNGIFSFTVPVASSGSYAVSVSTQPAGQVCSSQLGAVAADGAQTVTVNCVPSTYALSGTVTNLAPGAVLTLANGADSLVVSASGQIQFKPVALNGAYDVLVSTQPAGQTCTVNNGSGTGVTAAVSNVSVICSNLADTVGGTVTGLPAGDQVVLEDNGDTTDLVTVTANGAFQFKTPVANGANYNVTIASHTPAAGCSVSGGSGVAAGTNIASVVVTCGTPKITNLFSFANSNSPPSASNPFPVSPSGPLVSDGAGNLYGVSICGGANLTGAIYELSNVGGTWSEKTLYSFPADPSLGLTYSVQYHACQGGVSAPAGSPFAQPFELAYSNGVLYGAASGGGANSAGGFFSYNLATGVEADIASAPTFQYPITACGSSYEADAKWGMYSYGSGQSLTVSGGNLYWVSPAGGVGYSTGSGYGEVVEVSLTTGTATTLFSNFQCGTGTPGGFPQGVYVDPSGNIYSTAQSNSTAGGPGGVFEIPAGGGAPIVISSGSPFGADAGASGYWGEMSGIAEAGGVLYAVTPGAIAEVSLSGSTIFAQLQQNTPSIDGSYFASAPMVDAQGNLFAVTTYGGIDNTGTIVRVTPSGAFSPVVPTFGETNGSTNPESPIGGYLDSATGDMYVVARSGGQSGAGAVALVQ